MDVQRVEWSYGPRRLRPSRGMLCMCLTPACSSLLCVSPPLQVPRNIVSPQGNSPVMGIVQDALLGCSRLTRRDVFVEKVRTSHNHTSLHISRLHLKYIIYIIYTYVRYTYTHTSLFGATRGVVRPRLINPSPNPS